jgi:hypothetical protein
MKLGISLSFAAGVLVATLLGFRGGPSGDCRIGDMGDTLNAQAGKSLEQVFGSWVHKARQCHIGDYLVIAPSAAGQSDVLLSRNGKTFYVALSDTRIEIVDEGHALYEWDRRRKVITYAAYDGARKGWVENYDVNADGSIELRTIESGGSGKMREIPASDRWLPLVSRDGRSGTILNHQFVPIDDVRASFADGGAGPANGR